MAAVDPFADRAHGSGAPYRSAIAITPSDTVDLATVTSAIYVGVAGNITLITANGETVLFKSVPVGIFPVRASRVKAGATAATDMLALY